MAKSEIEGMGQPENKDRTENQVAEEDTPVVVTVETRADDQQGAAETEAVTEPEAVEPETAPHVPPSTPAHETLARAIEDVKTASCPRDADEALTALALQCGARKDDFFPDDVRGKLAAEALFVGIMNNKHGIVYDPITEFAVNQIGLEETKKFADKMGMAFVDCFPGCPTCKGHIATKELADQIRTSIESSNIRIPEELAAMFGPELTAQIEDLIRQTPATSGTIEIFSVEDLDRIPGRTSFERIFGRRRRF